MFDFNFEATLSRFPFTIKDDKGITHLCYLQELTGARKDKYLQDIADRARLDINGRPAGMKSFKDFSASMLQYGCFEVEWDGTPTEEEIADFKESGYKTLEGKPIPVATITKWPTRIQEPLNEKLKEMSGMGEKAEDSVKKE